MKTIIIITFFLLIGAFFIISENHIQLNSSENVDTFFTEYFNWLGELTNNGKVVSGYVTKMEWLPES